jgi:nitrogen regulatory protein P-II 1
MRKITAYIHDFMTDKVADALREENVHGVTVIKCEGFGRKVSAEDGGDYLDSDVEIGFARKTKIEIICRNEESDGIIELIQQVAHTGRHGDGKIFVSAMLDAIDIRTGNRGEEVL